MSKQDKIIEILAWLCIVAIIAFCVRFNYKLHTNEWTVQDYNTSITYNVPVS
jgi:hypothetical protein